MGKILPSLRQEPRSVRPFSIRLDNITTEIYTTLPARNPMCAPETMSLKPCAAGTYFDDQGSWSDGIKRYTVP